MGTSKKAWQTPELIVLVRSRPEEAVLSVCKYRTWKTGWHAPVYGDMGCQEKPGTRCLFCEVTAIS